MHGVAAHAGGMAIVVAVLALVIGAGGPPPVAPAAPSAPAGPGAASVGAALAARAAPAAAFPARKRVAAARRFLAKRAGIESLALIDSRGRLYGFAPRRVYTSASLVKAMLLVAYLRKIGKRFPDARERALLGPMIVRSDNALADAVYARVGDDALRRLAGRARMRRFSVAYHWGAARFSAADQARFFLRVDRLVPRRSRRYARRVLRSIVSYQRWGFASYASRAGFRTFFKGGWRGTAAGRLVHEAALFERGRTRFSLAVLTDGNPSHDYGAETLRGVAARVFGVRAGTSASPAALRAAGLRDVRERAPGIGVELAYGGKRNLTGRRLPGYCRPWAYLLPPAAADLARVQREHRRRGHGLLVLDAYRPARASRALVRWARRTGRSHLVGTYIARRSRHNTGSAVDLTLVRLRDGRRLRMGTGYDDL
ncbi:MAG TPA: M15 family metallopeptidase, partial [Thermoleophilaceae bacterium]|nr:M15 family metallopeptidase [Thermoleophilaceae bacterium]